MQKALYASLSSTVTITSSPRATRNRPAPLTLSGAAEGAALGVDAGQAVLADPHGARVGQADGRRVADVAVGAAPAEEVLTRRHVCREGRQVSEARFMKQWTRVCAAREKDHPAGRLCP